MNLRQKFKVVASNKIQPKIMGLNDFLLVQEVFLVFPLTPNDDKNDFGSSKEDKKKTDSRGCRAGGSKSRELACVN